MDPNANLATIRRLVKLLLDTAEPDARDVERLVVHVEALDEWLTRGGFLPEDWSKGLPKC